MFNEQATHHPHAAYKWRTENLNTTPQTGGELTARLSILADEKQDDPFSCLSDHVGTSRNHEQRHFTPADKKLDFSDVGPIPIGFD